jgi:hypothetical protein
MMRIEDETLMAFVDGELDEIARRRIAAAAAQDPELAGRIAAQRRLKARLDAHYGPAAEEEVPERLRALLEHSVVPIAPRRTAPAWRAAAALAASLLIGLAIGRTLPDGAPVRADAQGLYAQADLARALETQLASSQPADAPVRIGLSFTATDGALCRTFEGAALSGLACRAEAGWRLVLTAPGAGAAAGDGYRQAGAGVAVMEAAQEMMAGDPFDAAAEQAARARGWRR